MNSIRSLPSFTAWIDELKEEAVRGVIVARIKRLERGLMGDIAPVVMACPSLESTWARDGACISRNVFTQTWAHGSLLLAGGFKRTQKKDIKRAKALAALLD